MGLFWGYSRFVWFSFAGAKVQKIFNICKFWRLKNIEKYIKVVERNGKDEKSKLGGVAPRVRPAGRGQEGMEQEGMRDGERKTRRAWDRREWDRREKLVSFCLIF